MPVAASPSTRSTAAAMYLPTPDSSSGYPIFDLRSLRNPPPNSALPPRSRRLLRLMEEVLNPSCGRYGVPAGRICGLTGLVPSGRPPSSTQSVP